MTINKSDKPLVCTECGEEFLIKKFRTRIPHIID